MVIRSRCRSGVGRLGRHREVSHAVHNLAKALAAAAEKALATSEDFLQRQPSKIGVHVEMIVVSVDASHSLL